ADCQGYCQYGCRTQYLLEFCHVLLPVEKLAPAPPIMYGAHDSSAARARRVVEDVVRLIQAEFRVDTGSRRGPARVRIRGSESATQSRYRMSGIEESPGSTGQ